MIDLECKHLGPSGIKARSGNFERRSCCDWQPGRGLQPVLRFQREGAEIDHLGDLDKKHGRE